MFKKLKNNKVLSTFLLAQIICLISHLLIPFLIAAPIFNHFIEHDHEHNHFFLEMLIFMGILTPISLLVTFIYSKLTRKKHCCNHSEHIIACEECPYKEDALKYIKKLENEDDKQITVKFD